MNLRVRYNEDDAYDIYRQRLVDDEMNAPTQRIQFIEETHTYLLDGSPVPSVTEILKPLVDMSRVPPDVLEYKRSLGKAVHKAIDLDAKQDLNYDSLDPDIVPFFEAWLKWKRESHFSVQFTELVVWSRKLRYAGTLDLLGANAQLADCSWLVDLKCVWTMGAATGPQTAGYALATEESFGCKVRQRGGVQLLRDGTYRYFPYNNPYDEHAFKACLTINAFLRTHK